jgi:hypothetical protein
MKKHKLAKPLEELGKWFLNASLAFLVGLVIQPFTKGNKNYVVLGLVGIVIANLIGFSLIFISELIKEDKE